MAGGELESLPFTVKAELRDDYPFGTLAVPLADTGPDPRVLRHARQADDRRVYGGDIEVFADLNARAIAAMGGRPDDVLHERLRVRPVHRRARTPLRGERLGATVVRPRAGTLRSRWS